MTRRLSEAMLKKLQAEVAAAAQKGGALAKSAGERRAEEKLEKQVGALKHRIQMIEVEMALVRSEAATLLQTLLIAGLYRFRRRRDAKAERARRATLLQKCGRGQVVRQRAQQEMSERGRHFRAGQLAQAAQRWGSQGKMGQKWVGRYFAGKAAVLVQRRWRIQLLLRYSVLVQQRHTRGNLVQMRFGAKLREELTAERKAEQLLRVEALEHAWQAAM